MNTSTMIVAQYGSDVRNCDGISICAPEPCRNNWVIMTPPKRYAPTSTRSGRHVANTTGATATQPRPASTAEDVRQVAYANHRVADRVRGSRRLADGAQDQTPARTVQEPDDAGEQ